MTSNPFKAEYRQLGKSGLRVSVPILGAMSFGDKRWLSRVNEEEEAPKSRLRPRSENLGHSQRILERCI